MIRFSLLMALMTALPLPGLASVEEAKSPLTTFPACSRSTAWSGDTSLPPKWLKYFRESLQYPKSSLDYLSVIWRVREKEKDRRHFFFLSQWIGRLLVKAGLPLEGFHVLESLVASQARQPNRDALPELLSCLSEIKRRYPSLQLGKRITEPLPALTPAPGKPVEAWDDFRYLVSLESVSSASHLPLARATASVATVGDPRSVVLRALEALTAGNAQKALSALLAAEPDLAKLGPRQASSLYLLMGHLQYASGKFEEALHSYGKISADSNDFAEALRGIGWAQLSLGKYSSAVGSAYNLLVGPLQRTFQPEAYLIVAIAMNETCDYPRAMESVQAYKRAYAKTHAWLDKWKKDPAKIYPLLTRFLRDDSDIPARVGLEWARSPSFLSLQEEINGLIAERAALTQSRIKAVKGESLRAFLSGRREENLARSRKSVESIDLSLAERTGRMLASLNEVSEQMQLVQAEVLSNVGEKMILDNAGIKASAGPARDEGAEAPSGSVWNWGGYSSNTEEEGEFWNDELGFLKAEVKNQCL